MSKSFDTVMGGAGRTEAHSNDISALRTCTVAIVQFTLLEQPPAIIMVMMY